MKQKKRERKILNKMFICIKKLEKIPKKLSKNKI